MTMPVASLFGSAGLLGMIVARFLGTSAAVNHHKPVLVASFVCLIVAGLLALVHFTINFWIELNRTAESAIQHKDKNRKRVNFVRTKGGSA